MIKLYGVFRYEGQFIDTLEVFNVDKYEFNIKLEQIKKLAAKKEYKQAAQILQRQTGLFRRIADIDVRRALRQ